MLYLDFDPDHREISIQEYAARKRDLAQAKRLERREKRKHTGLIGRMPEGWADKTEAK